MTCEQVICTLTGDYYVCYSIPAVLGKLVAKLDKRANDHTITAKCGFKKKERVKKSPSKFPVPHNAPKWTYSSVTQAGTKRQIINEPSDGGEATASCPCYTKENRRIDQRQRGGRLLI